MNLIKLAKATGSIALGAAAMLGVSMVSAQAAPAPLYYKADCGVSELRMAAGKYDVNRAGVIKGDSICEYHFYAKKGQKVSADIVGSSDLYPMLYSEVSQDLSSEAVTLPKNGKYTIRVVQPAAKARQSKAPKPYYLTVTIK